MKTDFRSFGCGFRFANCVFVFILHSVVLFACSILVSTTLLAADRREAEKQFAQGEYAACLKEATVGVADYRYDELWWRLKIRAELQLGKYPDAKATLEEALNVHRASIVLRFLGHRVHALNNDPETALKMYEEIDLKVRGWPTRYSDSESSLILGKMLLDSGADARKVLELFYDRAKKLAPHKPEIYIASANLALEKFAYDLAAKDAQEGIKVAPENAELHFLLAQAFAPSDSEKATAALQKALELNPHHFGAHQMLAEQAISGEQYDEANSELDKILALNPHQQAAWTLKAVIANLKGDTDGQKTAYENATKFGKENPGVDHLLGLQLSQKYRFAEGAAFQRKALEKRAEYLPAKLQLVQDLLRLGDPEGWELAKAVNEVDSYNVVMHNLMTLHDRLQSYATLEDEELIVRMEAREAKLYGDEVIALLKDARATLAKKYDVTINKPIVVEIFPHQSDFAIRTFGLPGGDGFLGVCFGRVITANSPASRRDHPSNWKSVLWHEFCHAVTLEKTRNRMPRWLSEGISVYEERQKNSAWGEQIDPQYRQMLLGEDLTPVSQLSQAFLKPKSGLHLQFAYLESSLVVEYLVEEHGAAVLNKILDDLGAGIPINECLKRYIGSLAGLDEQFKLYAHRRAQEFGSNAEWEAWAEAELTPQSKLADIEAWHDAHADSYQGTELRAVMYFQAQEYAQAKPLLQQLIEWDSIQAGAINAYHLLAVAHRELGEVDEEMQVLNKWIHHDGDAVEAYSSLIDHAAAEQNWESLRAIGELMIAVDPLLESGHRARAIAAQKQGNETESLRFLPRLLLFDTADLADTHFQIAKLHFDEQHYDASRRHVLLSLEQAPRFRDAHRLLLALHAANAQQTVQESETITEEKINDKNITEEK